MKRRRVKKREVERIIVLKWSKSSSVSSKKLKKKRSVKSGKSKRSRSKK
jgi:hypothetical protein